MAQKREVLQLLSRDELVAGFRTIAIRLESQDDLARSSDVVVEASPLRLANEPKRLSSLDVKRTVKSMWQTLCVFAHRTAPLSYMKPLRSMVREDDALKPYEERSSLVLHGVNPLQPGSRHARAMFGMKTQRAPQERRPVHVRRRQ